MRWGSYLISKAHPCMTAWSASLEYLCIHALCNAHYLRELTFIFEQFGQEWAKEMKALLLEIKASVERAREQGLTSLPQATKQDFEQRYNQLVQTGMAANPPPQKRPGQRGKVAKSDALNLLLRLQSYQHMILRFMHDFAVSFTNNLAEADLRMMKLRQKIDFPVSVQKRVWLSFVTCAVTFPLCRNKAFSF